MFIGLESLETLNMSNNNLTYIDPIAFRHLENLIYADLSNNKLTLMSNDVYDILGPVSPLHYCYRLEELYLANNDISVLFSDWIISFYNLKELDLSFNSFRYLEVN